jgi:hypothetical protein
MTSDACSAGNRHSSPTVTNCLLTPARTCLSLKKALAAQLQKRSIERQVAAYPNFFGRHDQVA